MIEVRTPCRLHFGLLAFNPAEQRQFGGAGLMVTHPGSVVQVSPVPEGQGFTAHGRMADRALEFAQRFAQEAPRRGLPSLPGALIRVLRVPRPHTGLGSGTQLGMAIALALHRLADGTGLSVEEMAGLVGRGRRSAVGAHGFLRGGFLVDGGKPADAPATALSPLVLRHEFPADWRIVLIRPRALEGIAGERERQAFRTLPPIPSTVTDQLCRLVLLGLVPALAEQNLDGFGENLYKLQQMVGQCFASAQGGIYADPLLAEIVGFVRDRGVRGIGQSSWGPTLYAVTGDNESAEQLANDVEAKFGLHAAGEVLVTTADNHGATVRQVYTSPADR